MERKKALMRKKELKKLFKEKKYEKVLKLGEEILEKIPEDLDVLFIVGALLYKKGRIKTSMPYFDRVLEISQYDPEVLILKANCLLKLAKYDEALACCNKVKEIDEKNKAVAALLQKISKAKG